MKWSEMKWAWIPNIGIGWLGRSKCFEKHFIHTYNMQWVILLLLLLLLLFRSNGMKWNRFDSVLLACFDSPTIVFLAFLPSFTSTCLLITIQYNTIQHQLHSLHCIALTTTTGKGGKNRRRGKGDGEESKRELEFKEDGTCVCGLLACLLVIVVVVVIAASIFCFVWIELARVVVVVVRSKLYWLLD